MCDRALAIEAQPGCRVATRERQLRRGRCRRNGGPAEGSLALVEPVDLGRARLRRRRAGPRRSRTARAASAAEPRRRVAPSRCITRRAARACALAASRSPRCMFSCASWLWSIAACQGPSFSSVSAERTLGRLDCPGRIARVLAHVAEPVQAGSAVSRSGSSARISSRPGKASPGRPGRRARITLTDRRPGAGRLPCSGPSRSSIARIGAVRWWPATIALLSNIAIAARDTSSKLRRRVPVADRVGDGRSQADQARVLPADRPEHPERGEQLERARRRRRSAIAPRSSSARLISSTLSASIAANCSEPASRGPCPRA